MASPRHGTDPPRTDAVLRRESVRRAPRRTPIPVPEPQFPRTKFPAGRRSSPATPARPNRGPARHHPGPRPGNLQASNPRPGLDHHQRSVGDAMHGLPGRDHLRATAPLPGRPTQESPGRPPQGDPPPPPHHHPAASQPGPTDDAREHDADATTNHHPRHLPDPPRPPRVLQSVREQAQRGDRARSARRRFLRHHPRRERSSHAARHADRVAGRVARSTTRARSGAAGSWRSGHGGHATVTGWAVTAP